MIALDPNEDQGEFDDATSNGFARYAWAPFEFPEVPRVHITGPSPDSVMNLWCIDTGANVPVTCPEDTESIYRYVSKYEKLLTTAGPVDAQVAILHTPAGLARGLLSPGSPRILPGMGVSRNNGVFLLENGRAWVKQANGKLASCPVVHEIPYLPKNVKIFSNPNVRKKYNDNQIGFETDKDNYLSLEKEASPDVPVTSLADTQKYAGLDSSACEAVPGSLSGMSVAQRTEETSTAEQVESTVRVDSADTADQKSSVENRKREKGRTRDPPSAKDLEDLKAWQEHQLTHHPKRDDCEFCKIGKQPFTGFRRQKDPQKVTEIGGKLYADVCTTWPSAKLCGSKSFIGVLDEGSNLLFFEPLRGKISSAVAESLTRFLKELDSFREYTKGEKPKFQIVKCDWGGEFTALEVRDVLISNGVVMEHGIPSRHVASAERVMKVIAQGIRTLLLSGGLPSPYWTYAGRAFVHNMRCKNSEWVSYAKASGKPYKARTFGQLVYCKLPEVTLLKTDTPGTPCAFLAYETSKTTVGMYVAYINKKNKLTVTLIDGRDMAGVYWPSPTASGDIPMAFKRIVRNLQVLIVPGEEIEKKHVDLEVDQALPELEDDAEVLAGTAVPDKQGAPDLSARVRCINPDSSCPACRGRKRAHTYGPTCIYEGKPRFPSQVKPKVKEQGVFSVTESTNQHTLQTRVIQLNHEQCSGNESAALAGNSVPATQRTEKLDFAEESSVAVSQHLSSADNAVASTAVIDNSGRPGDVAVSPTQTTAKEAQADSPNASSTAESFARSALHELEKATLVHQDEHNFSPQDGFDIDDVESHLHRIHLTRRMTKDERASPAGQAALQKEMDKMCIEYNSFGKPIEECDAPKNSTKSGFCLLDFMKNYERPANERIPKGRAVVLGHIIRLIHNKVPQVEKSSEDLAAPSMAGMNDIAALEESRIVDAWGLLNDYEIQSVDAENGYLNERFPSDKLGHKHFVVIPHSLWHLLPDHLQPKGLKSPIFEMLTCIYGHPLSGSFFIEGVLQLLLANGYRPIGKVGSRALLIKDNLIVCVYVDDIKAAGPQDELNELWKVLSTKYKFKADPKVCDEFLGTQMKRDSTTLCYSNPLYCQEIFDVYEKFFGPPKGSRVPIVNNLRAYEKTPVVPDQRIQKLIGMILWLARTCRPDLSFPASCLGSRVAFWDASCQRELERVVAYIISTKSASLTMDRGRQVPGDFTNVKLAGYADADWNAPRSQSGYILFFENNPTGLRIPLHWGSKKQGVSAESAAAAESTAAYTAIRELLPVTFSCTAHFRSSFLRFILFTDNQQVLDLVRRGESEKLYFVHKSANVRMSFLQAAIQNGWLTMGKVATKVNPANLFTKALGRLDLEREAAISGLIFDRADQRAQRATLWQAAAARKIATT